MSSPSASSAANSLRTVDDETSTIVRSTTVLEPTGSPVATCSSTTPTENLPLPLGELDLHALQGNRSPADGRADPPGQELGRDRPAEEAAALRQRQRLASPLGEPEALHPRQRRRVERRLDAREGERLVEPEPQHQPLAPLHVVAERLVLARWPLAASERGHVAPRLGAFRQRRPPTVETAPIPIPT